MKFTILTEPVTVKNDIKQFLKHILGRKRKYGGHYGVTRSLVEGLNKIGYTHYNYQPKKEADIAEHVHVLAGVQTLKYAIELKRKGRIKRLTAGPNVVVFSTDYDSLIADDAIERYLQPSKWATDLHVKLEGRMSGRCLAWPAGVDLDKLQVGHFAKKERQVLIYHKDESDQFCYRVSYLLRKYGYEPVIIRYGNYRFEDYIRLLDESIFCVVLSRQESQGLYLAEAWAMDVPTICFEPHYYRWVYGDFSYEEAGNISTCPYLTEQTGVTFMELRELEDILRDMPEQIENFSPRRWVQENMSDEVCAFLFLHLMGYCLE